MLCAPALPLSRALTVHVDTRHTLAADPHVCCGPCHLATHCARVRLVCIRAAAEWPCWSALSSCSCCWVPMCCRWPPCGVAVVGFLGKHRPRRCYPRVLSIPDHVSHGWACASPCSGLGLGLGRARACNPRHRSLGMGDTWCRVAVQQPCIRINRTRVD